MRLIAGELGGRRLKTVMDADLRPAMGKTREALFSLLEAKGIEWENVTALDLFAGCGSLGFECVSRGAKRADFVENAQKQYEILRWNAENLGIFNRCGIYKQDVPRFLRQSPFQPYNLIFLDPPYGRNYANKCLESLVSRQWLANKPIIIAEVEKYIEPKLPESLAAPEKRVFGQTSVYIWNL